MNNFYYKNNELYVENVPVSEIIKQNQTPCYIYSRATIEANWRAFNKAFATVPHRICYAVKANSNIAILHLLAQLNSGFDIVSLGELERVIAAGGDPKKVVFSGVGKRSDEIKRALEVGIYCFNVESECEVDRINLIASELNYVANISLRLNPNIDARTHPYIATGLNENKFGIELSRLLPICQHIQTLKNIKLISIGCHIGSQLTELEPFEEALDCLLEKVDLLAAQGIKLKNVNIGGGLGIRYKDEMPPSIEEYVKTINNKLQNHSLEVIIEPGRILVGNAGILVTRVELLKYTDHKNFAIVDAGMNDLMRPALYEAWHDIKPIKLEGQGKSAVYDIVGPVCESADFFAKNRELSLKSGELLAIFSAGAYGFSMSSSYNSRPRAAEVLVENNQFKLIRRRETIEDLFLHEL